MKIHLQYPLKQKALSILGLYMMKHYKMPAPAFIAWNRICRPGSILGPQQQFLCSMQDAMFDIGRKSPIYSQLDDEIKEKLKKFIVNFWLIIGNES